MKFARSLGDVLIVGLNSDSSIRRLKGEGRPVNNQDDRAEVLCEFESVGYVVLFDGDRPDELIKIIKPDIYVKGADWKGKRFPDGELAEELGGKVVFAELVEGHSTTGTINRIAGH